MRKKYHIWEAQQPRKENSVLSEKDTKIHLTSDFGERNRAEEEDFVMKRGSDNDSSHYLPHVSEAAPYVYTNNNLYMRDSGKISSKQHKAYTLHMNDFKKVKQ